MMLEQNTLRILAAAGAQDLAELQAASRDRQSIIATLSSVPPSSELREAVVASIAAGKEAKRAIHAIRQRLRKEGRRLVSIEHGFLRTEVPAEHRIDCKG
jgi:hypothetical protein